MTQKEKNHFLLQDLCGRLSYGTFVQFEVDGHKAIKPLTVDFISSTWYHTEFIKPYLRPMCSMTDEEKEHLQSLHNIISDENYEDGYSPAAWETISEFNDYCHEHHLDNRGLISKGLALEAPEGMYDTKTE